MEKTKIGVGVVGCGHVAQFHLDSYTKNENVKVVAVSDSKGNKAKETSEKYACRAYLNYNEMFEKENLDVVSICTPTYLHKDILIAALQRNFNVLCEKPLALTAHEAREIKPYLKNQILMLGFCTRFHSPLIQAKQWIENGEIGNLLMFRSRLADYFSIENTWMAKRELGGGWYIEASQHGIDQFRWFAGEIESASGTTGTLRQNIDVEDSGVIVLKAKSGIIGIVEGSFATPFSENKIELYGTQGSIIVDFNQEVAKCRKEGKNIEYKSNLGLFHRFDLEIKHFIDCVLKNEQPLITFEDGLKTLEVLESVMKSERLRIKSKIDFD